VNYRIKFREPPGNSLTIFLRQIRVARPRRKLWNIKQIPNDRPRWWPRGIRETPSPSVIIEGEEGIKTKEEGEAVNRCDERDRHVGTRKTDKDNREWAGGQVGETLYFG
jgi:hypothetical protein